MTQGREYQFDVGRRIWVTPHHEGIAYSDGDEAELRLLLTLRNCADVSATSEELQDLITDWPSEYHFSRVRHNLLRPFPLGDHLSVLELGCGCGAMTRYLGENCAEVIAVDGSARRAEITAERCRDLNTVRIYCDNIATFSADEKFDLVTLIGVLEYAPLFIHSDDPVRTCIERAQTFLKDDGILILAIENQLGLKYFNGCSEDHTTIPYFGIHDLYGPNTPVTFGKRELEFLLRKGGLGSTAFYYPFPDYKLPNLILSDKILAHPNFRPADLLHRTSCRDYVGSARRAFHDTLVWRTLVKNGLLTELANSFLVLAHKSSQPSKQTGWLARVYSTDRLPAFAIETTFQPEDNSIAVIKRPLFPRESRTELANGLHVHHHPPHRAPYVIGQLYAAQLQFILARGGDLAAIATWAAPWVRRLVDVAKTSHTGALLPGDWLDAIPANFVWSTSGELVVIDLEWHADHPIALSWVLIRGLLNTLAAAPAYPALKELTLREIVAGVLDMLGPHEILAADFQDAATREDALMQGVYGKRHKAPPIVDLIDRPLASCFVPPTINEENETLRREIAALNDEIDRVKSSFSWHITKPMRAIANLPRLGRRVFEAFVSR